MKPRDQQNEVGHKAIEAKGRLEHKPAFCRLQLPAPLSPSLFPLPSFSLPLFHLLSVSSVLASVISRSRHHRAYIVQARIDGQRVQYCHEYLDVPTGSAGHPDCRFTDPVLTVLPISSVRCRRSPTRVTSQPQSPSAPSPTSRSSLATPLETRGARVVGWRMVLSYLSCLGHDSIVSALLDTIMFPTASRLSCSQACGPARTPG